MTLSSFTFVTLIGVVVVAGIAIVILAVMIISSSVGPKNGSIYVASPSEASVYLDGSYKGTTPKTITCVSAGSHTIMLSKIGYKNAKRKISVKAGEKKRINANLIRRLIIRKDKKG